jgi:hypothetical protein
MYLHDNQVQELKPLFTKYGLMESFPTSEEFYSRITRFPKKAYWGIEQVDGDDYHFFVWGELKDEETERLNNFIIEGTRILGIPLRPDLF